MTLLDELEVRFLANRDPHLHFALLSDFADAASGGSLPDDARWSSARSAAIDAAERAPRRRSLLSLSPRAPLERARAAVDGVGAQARQARRVQPAAARRDRHQLRRACTAICRCCRRSATSSRSTPTRSCRIERRRRLVGTLAHPLNRPRFDAARRARDRRLRRAAAARRKSTSSAPTARVRAGLRRARRPRSVHDRVVRRLPGPVPRGQLRRQGHLRRRRLRGALAGRVPENTLLSHDLFEGSTRAPGCAPTSSWSTTIRRNYLAFAARQHRWVRGDWQIARWLWRTVPDASGPRVPQHPAGRRALEDSRQPAAQPARAGAARRCSSPAGRCYPGRRASGRCSACWCSPSRPTSQLGRSLVQPGPRRSAARAPAGRARQPRQQRRARHFSRRCSSPHQAAVMLDAIGARSSACSSRAGTCSNGSRPTARAPRAARPPACCGACGRRRLPPSHRRARGRVCRAARGSRWRAVPRCCGCVSPARRLRDGPAAPARTAADRCRRPSARISTDRARRTWRSSKTFVGAGRPLAHPRQLSRRTAASRRAPHVADQHRAAAARRRWQRTTSAISRVRPRSTGSSRPSPRCSAAALPRALLQLVRHAHARAARCPRISRPSTAATSPAIC